jgi:hypothetical protein
VLQLGNKRVFNEIEMFDEHFKRLQDLELHTRLLLKGYHFRRVDIIDSWYRTMDSQYYLNTSKLPYIIDAYLMYIDKYWHFNEANSPLSNNELRISLRVLYLYVLKKFVLRDKPICLRKVIKFNNQKKIVPRKVIFLVYILSGYHVLGLNNRFGYTKLRNLIFNG